MPILLANNYATTTLAGPVSNTSPIVVLASGSGAAFPNPSNGQYFALTLNDALTGLVYEITYCVQRVGDVCTVTRGQEGTTAVNWLAGDIAVGNMTAGQLEQMAQVFYFTGSNPNGSVAGTTGVAPVGGASGLPPSFCWAATGGYAGTGALWGCTQTGPAATAQWVLFAGGFTGVFGTADSTSGGYRIGPDGFIQQWGLVSDNSDIAQSVIFPLQYPNQRLGVVCQKRANNLTDVTKIIVVGIGPTPPYDDLGNENRGFNWYCWDTHTNAGAVAGNFTWYSWGF